MSQRTRVTNWVVPKRHAGAEQIEMEVEDTVRVKGSRFEAESKVKC